MDRNEQKDMLPAERQAYILDLLKERKSASVKRLAAELFINEATVRRDLNALAQKGAVTRNYGGAALNEGPDSEIPFFVRETAAAEAKRQIGESAAEFIRDGETVFLDSSSTVSFLIPRLRGKKGLKIVTNGAKAVLSLAALGDCEIYSTGGKLRENSLSFAGTACLRMLEGCHFDAAFFSCRGVHPDGLTDSSPEEAEIRRVVIRNAGKKYLLADRSKLGAVSFSSVCPLRDVTAIFTDGLPSAEWQTLLRAEGVALYL